MAATATVHLGVESEELDAVLTRVEALGEYVKRIEVLLVEPGDTLVLSTDETFSRDTIGRLREMVRELFPDNRVMVLERGMSLSAVRRGE